MSDPSHGRENSKIPLLNHKNYREPSVFTVENLLREARRQKNLPEGSVPAVCVLDPDGDLVDYLHATDRATSHPTWALSSYDAGYFRLSGS